MNTRDRFLTCFRYQDVDHVPCVEMGIWGQAYDRWFNEGLSKETDWDINHLKSSKHFNLEGFVDCPVNFCTCPEFEHTVLEEDQRTVTYIDKDGATRQGMKEGRGHAWNTAACMDHFIKFPVNNREEFERIKSRFNPDDASRYPDNWQALLVEYKKRDYPLNLKPGGHFGLYSGLRRWMGTGKRLYDLL